MERVYQCYELVGLIRRGPMAEPIGGTKGNQMKTCEYDLRAMPAYIARPSGNPTDWTAEQKASLKWTTPEKGGFLFCPLIGTRVNVTCNSMGLGTVSSYFFEHGYLGVKVDLDNPPDWHKKQNPGKPYALVFGSEIQAKS